MAETLHAQTPVTAPPAQHPIQLHAAASNSLQRCLRLLNADAVDYHQAEQHLNNAAKCLLALRSIKAADGEGASC